MSQLVFDEDIAKQMETLYRTRDVRRRRALVSEALAVREGERVLDVGCGPGFYAEELLEVVGPSGAVVGVDSSPQMLAVAADRCARHPNAAFHQADATALPVEEASFDAALCVQGRRRIGRPAGAPNHGGAAPQARRPFASARGARLLRQAAAAQLRARRKSDRSASRAPRTHMDAFVSSLVPVATVAVAFVLLLGLVNMLRGGSPSRSQRLMRARVLLQFTAIIVIMGVVWWRAT
jgi:SAM-dependent methyltransferase